MSNKDVSREKSVMLPLESIKPPAHYIRSSFREGFIARIEDEIKQWGRPFEPILVRPTSDEKYEIIDGVHRYYACLRAGIKEIPAIIQELGDAEAILASYRINRARNNVDANDTVKTFYLLVKECKVDPETATRMMRLHPVTRSRILQLYSANPGLIEDVAKGKLSLRKALEMIGKSVEAGRKPSVAKKPEELSDKELIDELRKASGYLFVLSKEVSKRSKSNNKIMKYYSDIRQSVISMLWESINSLRSIEGGRNDTMRNVQREADQMQ